MPTKQVAMIDLGKIPPQFQHPQNNSNAFQSIKQRQSSRNKSGNQKSKTKKNFNNSFGDDNNFPEYKVLKKSIYII